MSFHRQLALGTFFALACQAAPPSEMTESERATVADSARAVIDSAFAAIVRVDPAGLMRLFASGSEPTFSADGVLIAGYDSIAAYFQGALANWQRVDSATLSGVRVSVLNPGAAVVAAYYRERVTDRTGTAFWNAGAWSTTVVRRGGRWYIVDSHASHPRSS